MSADEVDGQVGPADLPAGVEPAGGGDGLEPPDAVAPRANQHAAVVVGGASLGGGKGTIGGTVAGVLIMSILTNMVLLLNFDVELGMIVEGIVLITAVSFYSLKEMR